MPLLHEFSPLFLATPLPLLSPPRDAGYFRRCRCFISPPRHAALIRHDGCRRLMRCRHITYQIRHATAAFTRLMTPDTTTNDDHHRHCHTVTITTTGHRSPPLGHLLCFHIVYFHSRLYLYSHAYIATAAAADAASLYADVDDAAIDDEDTPPLPLMPPPAGFLYFLFATFFATPQLITIDAISPPLIIFAHDAFSSIPCRRFDADADY